MLGYGWTRVPNVPLQRSTLPRKGQKRRIDMRHLQQIVLEGTLSPAPASADYDVVVVPGWEAAAPFTPPVLYINSEGVIDDGVDELFPPARHVELAVGLASVVVHMKRADTEG